jgi:hypothetical protein
MVVRFLNILHATIVTARWLVWLTALLYLFQSQKNMISKQISQINYGNMWHILKPGLLIQNQKLSVTTNK